VGVSYHGRMLGIVATAWLQDLLLGHLGLENALELASELEVARSQHMRNWELLGRYQGATIPEPPALESILTAIGRHKFGVFFQAWPGWIGRECEQVLGELRLSLVPPPPR
jgi:hypothetical protein